MVALAEQCRTDPELVVIPVPENENGKDTKKRRGEIILDKAHDTYPRFAAISLMKRLDTVIPSLEDDATVLSIGISVTDAEMIANKYHQELERRNIKYVQAENFIYPLPFSDKSVGAVIGNLPWKRIPFTLRELTRVTQPQGDLILNIHAIGAQDDNDITLDSRLYRAGLHVSGTRVERSGEKAWWAVDASTMPEVMPLLRSEMRGAPQPRIYGGADLEFYK